MEVREMPLVLVGGVARMAWTILSSSVLGVEEDALEDDFFAVEDIVSRR